MTSDKTPGLIATDVDGTLLDEDERVTPRTRAAVRAAVAAGATFVLATGAPRRGGSSPWWTGLAWHPWRSVPTGR